MNFNLFIQYNILAANEKVLINSIQKLGNVTRIDNGFWYVNSTVDANEAIKRLASWVTDKDRVMVIDASNNQVFWYNLDDVKAQRIRQNWTMALGAQPNTLSGNEAQEAEEETTH
jgi:predicted proteasome-type protease